MITFFTIAHKRPDFLELQWQSFQKHINEPFSFVVLNNAAFDIDRSNFNAIQAWCMSRQVNAVSVERDELLITTIHDSFQELVFNGHKQYTNAGIACAYPLCWAWKHIISTMSSTICIIDSDMFFVHSFNSEEVLADNDLLFVAQSRGENITYMWNGIVFAKLNKLPHNASLNWWCGHVNGAPVDVGGQTYHYLKEHGYTLQQQHLSIHYVGEDRACDFSPANYEYVCLHDIRYILHFRGGSNWHNCTEDYILKKTAWLVGQLNAS